MLKELFNRAYDFMRINEGGFSNYSDDVGGMTIWGISVFYHPIWFAKVYSAFKRGYVYKAESLAKEFYYKKYWNELYEKINDEKLAIRLFDVSVNIGKKRAIKKLQYIVNAGDDGIFGSRTLAKVNDFGTFLYDKYVEALEKFYRSRRKFKKFGVGWLNRLNKSIII
jgi:lysozyme family protein